MTLKVKVFLTFMVVVTIFSVLSFFDVFRGARSVKLSDPGKPFPLGITDDVDQDGLSNSDESYWNTDFKNPDTDGDGFLDGEEVASSHDPNTPRPDDALIHENLTDRLSDLVAAGLVEGSLKPGNPNYDRSLDDLALSIIDATVSSLTPAVDLSKLIIIDPSRENQEAYLKKVKSIFRQFLKTVGDQTNRLKFNSQDIFLANDKNARPDDSFLAVAEEFQKIYDQAFSAPVPSNWKSNHASLLTILGQLSETNKMLAYRARDPVKAVGAFSFWSDAYDNIVNLIASYADQMTKEGLTGSLTK